MNREIKFRIYHKKEKVMVYLDEMWMDHEYSSLAFGSTSEEYSGHDALPGAISDGTKEYRIMQYTGLKDKNGKEIYEGDILQYKTTYYGVHKVHTTLVEWKDDLEHDGFGEPLAMGYIFHGIELEVIGNQFQNPELLNINKSK